MTKLFKIVPSNKLNNRTFLLVSKYKNVHCARLLSLKKLTEKHDKRRLTGSNHNYTLLAIKILHP